MNTLPVGGIVKLKKNHPCGGNRWQILESGLNIRLKCLHCGRKATIPRDHLLRKMVSCDSPQE